MVFFLAFNIILVLCIFWVITFVGSFFYKVVQNKTRVSFYECGFKTTSDYGFKLNSGMFITMLFVLIYDVELLFLVPVFLNSIEMTKFQVTTLIVMYIYISLSFFIDMFSDFIKWDVR